MSEGVEDGLPSRQNLTRSLSKGQERGNGSSLWREARVWSRGSDLERTV